MDKNLVELDEMLDALETAVNTFPRDLKEIMRISRRLDELFKICEA